MSPLGSSQARLRGRSSRPPVPAGARAGAAAGGARFGRLDQWLVERGHAETRREAQAAIMAGLVTVDGQIADKPGRRLRPGAEVQVRPAHDAYVSRGGLKLAHALAVFGVDVSGRVAVDLGASTGGFTDCLLQAGAVRVYAVDVGHGQLAWSLRRDPRVVCLEGVNARYLTPDQVGGRCDVVTADLAFISLRLVWRAIAGLLAEHGVVIALVKPQFEAGRERIGQGGVVRDPAVHREVLAGVLDAAPPAGLTPRAVTPSPIVGPAGNIEYLVCLSRDVLPGLSRAEIDAVVADAHRTVRPRRRRP